MLRKEFSDQRVVEKILVCLLERFESKISSLKKIRIFLKSHLLSLLMLCKLLSLEALCGCKKILKVFLCPSRKANTKVAIVLRKSLLMKRKVKEKNGGGQQQMEGWKKKFSPCQQCKKDIHSEMYCWYMSWVKCRACDQFSHVEMVCKNKANQ